MMTNHQGEQRGNCFFFQFFFSSALFYLFHIFNIIIITIRKKNPFRRSNESELLPLRGEEDEKNYQGIAV